VDLTGQVVATDFGIRHLAAIAAPNVDVLYHDLTVSWEIAKFH
jgi:hypothetical protein